MRLSWFPRPTTNSYAQLVHRKTSRAHDDKARKVQCYQARPALLLNLRTRITKACAGLCEQAAHFELRPGTDESELHRGSRAEDRPIRVHPWFNFGTRVERLVRLHRQRKKPPVTGRLKSEAARSALFDLGLGLGFHLGRCRAALVVTVATLTLLHFVGLSAHNFFTLPNCFCWLA